MKSLLKFASALLFVTPLLVRAGTIDQAPASVSDSSTNPRYGLFNGLQQGSTYGQGSFPEPFLVDDSDLEVNEFRLDFLRTGAGAEHSDTYLTELEKGFGQMTLEIEIPIERDSADGHNEANFDNIDLGARYPLYQVVAPSGNWDTSFGVAAEVGVPTRSNISKTTEIVPKVFNDTTIGHFTMQSILGYSTFAGPHGDGGGQQTFEYGFVFGYTIPHDQLPIPGVLQFIPVSEISGAKGINMDTGNSVIADIGFRANLKTIGDIQPRLGAVAVFPLTSTAREDLHWGILTSLVFEF